MYTICRNLLICFSSLTIIIACASDQHRSKTAQHVQVTDKISGAHVFRFRDSLDVTYYKNLNIDWITVVPWGYMDDYQSASIRHYWVNEEERSARETRWINRIKKLKKDGFKVFVKPHIWLTETPHNTWRSDIFPPTDSVWAIFQKDYREFIFRYAALAEEAGADMFCIGTELSKLSFEKHLFWETLIADVREIFSGDLTYAANWYKEYDRINFWSLLDYIGVQAYFPLANEITSDLQTLENGWGHHAASLEEVAKKYGKPILFTELGYRSHIGAAVTPWEWIDYEYIDPLQFSEITQANCYRAFFNVIWSKDWFKGVLLWQFREGARLKENDQDFYPKGKMAEQYIKEGFAKK